MPRPRPSDTVLSSAPLVVPLSTDDLQRGFGFRNVNVLTDNISSITQNSIRINDSGGYRITDLGQVATINKSNRNTKPLTLPPAFGDLVHCDILYGPTIAVLGYKYCLFLVDKATRFKIVYGMKRLTDVLSCIRQFQTDIGIPIKELRSDFDPKILNQQVRSYLALTHCKISGCPSGQQNKNGLCERNWRTLLCMATSWLTSNLLPSRFWFFALKRAAEVSNYLPITIDNQITTPFELVYKIKPDLRVIFPIFSVAYVHKTRDGTTNCLTFHSNILRCIAVGRHDFSDQLIFYHPPTKQIVCSDDYTLDKELLCSGPCFHLDYDGGLYIYQNIETMQMT